MASIFVVFVHGEKSVGSEGKLFILGTSDLDSSKKYVEEHYRHEEITLLECTAKWYRDGIVRWING